MPKAKSAPGVEATDDASALKEGIASIRKDLKRLGSAIGAGATVVVAGVGWSTLHNIYPVPQDERDRWLEQEVFGLEAYVGLPEAVLLCSLLAAIATLILTATFFAAQRRVVFEPSRPEDARGLAGKERKLVKKILTEHAHEENARDAGQLELRALRLDRVSRCAADASVAVTATTESERIYQKLSMASMRAALSVVEGRSEQLFKLRPFNLTLTSGLVAVSALISLFLLADYSKGQRDLIDLQTKCVDSEKAPAACSGVADQGPESTTPGPEPADTEVIERIKICLTELEDSPEITNDLRDVAIAVCSGLAPPDAESDASPTTGETSK